MKQEVSQLKGNVVFTCCRLMAVSAGILSLLSCMSTASRQGAAPGHCEGLAARGILDITCHPIWKNSASISARVQAILDSLAQNNRDRIHTVYFPPGEYPLYAVRVPNPGVARFTLTGRIDPNSHDPKRTVFSLMRPKSDTDLEFLECHDGSPILSIAGPNITIRDIRFEGYALRHERIGHSESWSGGGISCKSRTKNPCYGLGNETRFLGPGVSFRAAIRADAYCVRKDHAKRLDGLKVTNNSFQNIYGAAIAARNLSDVEISGNSSTDSLDDFAYLASIGPKHRSRVRVTNNQIRNLGQHWDHDRVSPLLTANAIQVGGTYSDVLIEGNKVVNVDKTLVRLMADNVIVRNNEVSRNYRDGFGAIDVHGAASRLTISGNRFDRTGRGITMNTSLGCDHVTIEGNTIENTHREGILLGGPCIGPHIRISHNKLKNVGVGEEDDPRIFGRGLLVIGPVQQLEISDNVMQGTFPTKANGFPEGNAIMFANTSLPNQNGIAKGIRILRNRMEGFTLSDDCEHVGCRTVIFFRGFGYYEDLTVQENAIDSGGPHGRAIWASERSCTESDGSKGGDICDRIVGNPKGKNFLLSGIISKNTIRGRMEGNHCATQLIVDGNRVDGLNNLLGRNHPNCP